MMESFGTKGAL